MVCGMLASKHETLVGSDSKIETPVRTTHKYCQVIVTEKGINQF